MTSEQKVLAKYPEAEAVSRRIMGRTLYAIRASWNSRLAVGFGFTASSAWVAAAKNIAENKPLESLSL